jgi:hypothetical protein
VGTQRFSLGDGEPARLAVQWRGLYRDLVVTLDDRQLARHASLEENDIFAFDVDDKRVIIRRLKAGLEARIDARILEGSASHPVTEAKMAIRGAALLVALQPAYTLGVWLYAGLAVGYPRTDGETVGLAALAALGLVSLVLAPMILARSSASALTSLPVIVVHGLLLVGMTLRLDEPLGAVGIGVMELGAFVACLVMPLSVRILEAHQRASAVGGASSTAATR